jgi:hypothetical protein
MNETFFFRLPNDQWFQFTGTRKQGDRLFKTFNALKQPVQGWTTGVDSFEHQYGLEASKVPSFT